MKFSTKFTILFMALIMSMNISSFAQKLTDHWTNVSQSEFSGKFFLESLPSQYRLIQLDFNAMKAQLDLADFDDAPNAQSQTISVPMPDGKNQRFTVYRREVISKSIGKPFENIIRTFIAKGIDDPYAVARFDYTVWGFHGLIMSPNGYVVIEPYTLGNTANYISFDRRHSTVRGDFVCETAGNNNTIQQYVPSNNASQRSSGASLRTYRLALACTGEYAAFYGGTPAGAFSGMVTSVNRVTGVYELELSVRLVLISNTNLVYTNAATDPYTNNNGSTLLGENQTNITNIIGSANYDIGHVFSTGGGGVAGLGVVCNATNKARGVTGSSAPVGDAYDIDYVAHEMGHEFGGNHTFNSVTGSCSGNRASTAAYEPGSGTTIMAYAGICGADDIQPHSDAIFASKSFDEIQTFITTGGGSSCPVSTATGNTAPVITVPGNFSIPYKTPFQLTGSATDANGDPLTYLWEEYDLGASGAPNSPSGTAPIFRVWTPVTTGTRVFPRMQDIVNNTQTLGEILPTYARAMNFKFSARDNRLNGAAITNNDVLVTVTAVNTTVPFAVTAPNTAVTWTTASTQTVSWDVASTTAAPINCANVNILMSTDGGFTYPFTLASGVPNTGTASIVVPSVLTTTARVRVEGAGNIFFDISNTNFTIIGGSPVLTSITTNTITPTSICAGGTLSVSFNGDGPANAGNIFTAQLSNAAGSFASPVAIGTLTSTSTSGTISCTIPALTAAGSGYRIRVVASNPSVIGTDNGANLTVLQTVGAAGAITGTASVCQGQTGVVYSVAAIANATSYNWVLPSGASITAGSGTNSITVTFSVAAASGNITVNGLNSCSNGASSSFAITVNTLPTALSAITGNAGACVGQAITYTVPTNPTANSYSWTVSSGMSIQSGNGTNSISVLFTASGLGTISVAGVNACGTGSATSLNTTVFSTGTAPVVSAGGPTAFCNPGSVALSFSATAGNTYQWLNNGSPIGGAVSSPLNATATGNYSVAMYTPQTFTNNTVFSIPDNNCTGISSPITISGYSGTVPTASISISLNITHTWDADLTLVLQAPNGALLGLASAVGSSGDNFTNSVFTDAAAAVIPATGAPYTGTYKPAASIFTTCTTTTVTSFGAIGAGSINPNGTWRLFVYDNAAQDVGTINSFSITFPASANVPCSVQSNSIPVVVSGTPSISSFSPTSGNAGTSITILGSGFTGATAVTFNGVASSFTVTNDGQIVAIVPAGSTTGLINVTTPCGNINSSSVFGSSVTLNLKVLLEGYTITAGTMRLPLGSTCDSIEVSLASSTSPYAILYTTKNVINSTGNGTFTFPGAVQGGNFYIVVRHRNSIETWSGAAIAFPSVSNSFDFSTGITQAFGSNLVLIGGGKYAIRSGDINQNGVIDHADVQLLEGSLSGMSAGYQVNDLTGDNLVESADYSLVESNSKSSITVKKP